MYDLRGDVTTIIYRMTLIRCSPKASDDQKAYAIELIRRMELVDSVWCSYLHEVRLGDRHFVAQQLQLSEAVLASLDGNTRYFEENYQRFVHQT